MSTPWPWEVPQRGVDALLDWWWVDTTAPAVGTPGTTVAVVATAPAPAPVASSDPCAADAGWIDSLKCRAGQLAGGVASVGTGLGVAAATNTALTAAVALGVGYVAIRNRKAIASALGLGRIE